MAVQKEKVKEIHMYLGENLEEDYEGESWEKRNPKTRKPE